MNDDTWYERKPGRSAAVWTLVFLTIIAANVAGYFEVFTETRMTARLYGLILPVSMVIPVIAMPLLYSFRFKPWHRLKGFFGRPVHWVLAVFVPMAAYGIAAGMHAAGGGEFKTDWKWITYALGALFDIPLLCIWLTPMLIAGLMVFVAPFLDRNRRMNRTAQSIAVGILVLAASLHLVVYSIMQKDAAQACLFACSLFGAGVLSGRLMGAGAPLPSVIPLTIAPIAGIVMYGSNVAAVNALLLGDMVREVAGGMDLPGALRIPASFIPGAVMLIGGCSQHG
jgi:hypothetical protein